MLGEHLEDGFSEENRRTLQNFILPHFLPYPFAKGIYLVFGWFVVLVFFVWGLCHVTCIYLLC